MEQTECSETSAYKLQTPGNYPEENIQHSEHGESLKSRNTNDLVTCKLQIEYVRLKVSETEKNLFVRGVSLGEGGNVVHPPRAAESKAWQIGRQN